LLLIFDIAFMKNILTSTFGLGKIPWAPGTWGSLPPVILYQALGYLYPASNPYVMAALLVVFSWICVRFSPAVIRQTGKADPREVVADETAGQALTMLAITILHPVNICNTAALGFALFRLFDIAKPWPIRKLETLPAGWGILADDLAAGLAAAVVALIAIRFLPVCFL
jgi:phosphatidylglycerophosphatase A